MKILIPQIYHNTYDDFVIGSLSTMYHSTGPMRFLAKDVFFSFFRII